VIDDLSTGHRNFLNSKAHFAQLNIFSDREKLEKFFASEKFDLVNHHAAQVDVRVSVANPQLDASINLLGLIHLLQNCITQRVSQFIFVSSGGVVYGDSQRLPLNEEESKKPMSPYGVAKLASEYYLMSYRLNYGLNYLALRYANVYGPRQTPKSEATVVSTFARQMLRNEMPTIFGDGSQTRDYIYIADIVRANLLATRHLLEINKIKPEKLDDLAFNIGTGKETNVKETFEVLRREIGFTGEPRFAPARTGEIMRSALDTKKAEKIMGFKAQQDFQAGVRETIAWLRDSKLY
jgi:UDP-glucose 4-epimerase